MKLIQIVGVYFLAALGVKGLILLLAWSCPPFLQAATFPCHVRFPSMADGFLQANKGVNKAGATVFCNVITYSCTSVIFVLIRSKSQVSSTHLRGEEHTKAWIPGGKDDGAT